MERTGPAPTLTASEPPPALAEGDAALAMAIIRREAGAWERFFVRFYPWTFRFAYHHLGRNLDDAQDLCADILLVAARSLRSYRPDRGTLEVWLVGLARHRLSHFCRKRRLEAPVVPDIPERLPDEEGALSVQWVEESLLRGLTNRALAALPPKQAALLIGKYVSGYSLEELAERHDTTIKAVGSLLVRARTAFRLAFRSLLEDEEGGTPHG